MPIRITSLMPNLISKFKRLPEKNDDTKSCVICRGIHFKQHTVLPDELIEQWSLSPEEIHYINRQQGYKCCNCDASLRSQTLAGAIMSQSGECGSFKEFCDRSQTARKSHLLEINEAGNLTPYLSRFRHYGLAKYPDIDMQQLPYEDNSWDIVVHSDTLEHVPQPLMALKECRRVIRKGGFVAFTIPIVYGRLNLSRERLEPSYHLGTSSLSLEEREGYRVHTEYGADFWVNVMQAGFTRIELFTIDGPGCIAIIARK